MLVVHDQTMSKTIHEGDGHETEGGTLKNLMTKHHDMLVKPRQFNIGDLVLKMVSLATKDPTHGKLGPN